MDNNGINIRVQTTTDTSGIDKTNKSLDALGGSTSKNVGFVEKLNSAFAPLAAITASAGIGLSKLTGFMGDSVGEATKLQSAMTGLNSIARAFKQDAGAAQKAAQDLAKDGLMTVTDSATGLKNLLASGFSLDQAVTLMTRFKDTAAFGKQGALSFGEAIRGATEGIKNGNSILVDNAGITKNLSIILKEAGFAENDLMKATSDASVRQALYNGLLKESAPMLGDAEKLTNLYAGSQAKAAAQTKILKQNIGTALQSALLPLLKAIVPLITAISNWVQSHQKLSAMIGIAMAVFLGLITILGLVGTAMSAIAPIIAIVGLATVGWVVIIIAAFAACVAAIIMFWEPIKGFFVGLWQGIQDVIHGFINWLTANWPIVLGILTGPIGLAVGLVIKNWSSITEFFSRVPEMIRNAFSNLTNIITAPFSKAFDFIKDIPGKIVNSIGNIGNLLRDKLGNWDIPGPLGKVKDVIPGFADGGFTGRGSASSVAGVVHKGEYVIPQSGVDQRTGLPKNSGGGGITINFNGTVNMRDEQEATNVGAQLARQLQAARAGAF